MTRCYEAEARALPSISFLSAVNPLIRTNIVRLILECSGFDQHTIPGSANSVTPSVMVPDTVLSHLIYAGALAIESALNMTAVFTFVPVAAWAMAPALDVTTALARGDGSFGDNAWLMNPQIAGSLVDLGAMQDLSGVVQADENMQWLDIHPFYRVSSANYGNKVVMLPISGAMLVMYVRRDVLAAQNQSVPATWEDLIAVAAALNGTDMNGDRVGDPAICFAPFLLSYLVTAIWASVVQTQGMQQGLYYDALTMQVMANTSSFAYALQLLQRMTPYALPLPVLTATLFSTVSFYQPLFSDGGCAITFGATAQFKRNSFGAGLPRYARGRVITAPLPGSTLVYNRATAVLEACTPATCPYASMMTTASGSQALVNTAPCTSSTAGAVNALAPIAFVYYAYAFLSILAYPELSTVNLLNPLTDSGPLRQSQLDPTLMQATYNTSWVAASYEASDVASMLATLNAALAHPNVALGCRLPNSVAYSMAMTKAAFAATSGRQTVDAAMAGLSAALQTIVPAGGLLSLQAEYWASLNMNFAPPPAAPGYPPPLPVAPRLSGLAALLRNHTSAAVAVLVLAGVAVFVLIAAAVWVVYRQRWCHMSLWGRVLAPVAGPRTTLLVTDIESSTTLWETFDDARVMDTALRLHHTIIRRLLIEHAGYETATEGDSFIVAFHCPRKALQFAVDAQKQLLAAPWPEELDTAPAARGLWSAVPGEGAPGDGGSLGFLETGSVQSDEGPAGSNSFFSLVTSHFTGAVAASHSLASSGHKAASWSLTGGRNVRSALALHFPVSEERGQQGLRRGKAAAAAVHRGLRVRIGMHSGGLLDADVNTNAASGRTTYSGECLVLAKAVADAAHGGQILFSDASHTALCAKSDDKAAARKLPFVSWHAGLHTLKEGLPPLHLYMATSRCLIPRAALFPPLRTVAQRLPGVLDAPLGVLAIASLTLPGASALLAWDWEEATHAVSVFQAACAAVADEYHGFVSEGRVGEMVGAFSSCSAAVAWSLHVMEALKRHPWSPVLLSHPLCEDLCIMDNHLDAAIAAATAASSSSKPASRRKRRSVPPLAPVPPRPSGSPSSLPAGSGTAAGRASHKGFSATFPTFSRSRLSDGGGGGRNSGGGAGSSAASVLLTLTSLPAGGARSEASGGSITSGVPSIIVELAAEDGHSSPRMSPEWSPAPAAAATGYASPYHSGRLATPSTRFKTPSRPASSSQLAHFVLSEPLPLPATPTPSAALPCGALVGRPASGSQLLVSELRAGAAEASSSGGGGRNSPRHSLQGAASAVAAPLAVMDTRAQLFIEVVVDSFASLLRLDGGSSPKLRGLDGGKQGSESSPQGPQCMADRLVRAGSPALVLFRGPRVRAGVALGEVSVDVSSTTSRLTYRGKAATLAARIAEVALSSQVLCSQDVCEALAAADRSSSSSGGACAAEAVVCTPAGRVLKSLQERSTLCTCRFRTSADDEVLAAAEEPTPSPLPPRPPARGKPSSSSGRASLEERSQWSLAQQSCSLSAMPLSAAAAPGASGIGGAGGGWRGAGGRLVRLGLGRKPKTSGRSSLAGESFPLSLPMPSPDLTSRGPVSA